VLGYIEGAGRALLATLAVAFSFILAANLRSPLGDRLTLFWTSFGSDYNLMLAFLISFVVAIAICAAIIIGTTRRQALLPNSTVLDPLLGGAIALVAAVLVLAAVIADLDTVYRLGRSLSTNDVPFLGSIHELLVASAIGHWVEGAVVPVLAAVSQPLIPEEFVRLIRG
jgi:hypothetical protein